MKEDPARDAMFEPGLLWEQCLQARVLEKGSKAMRQEGNFGKKKLDMQRYELAHSILEIIQNLLSGLAGIAD